MLGLEDVLAQIQWEKQEVRKAKQLVFTIFGGEKKNDYKGINFIFLFI